MSDAKYHQEHANSIPLHNRIKLFPEELNAQMQSAEQKSTMPTAPFYEETNVSSYPVLPIRFQPPMYQSSSYPPTMVDQPHPVVHLVHQNPPVGPESTALICPSCKEQISTKVNHVPNTKTHLISLLLCVFGCWCCVCCPYCMDDCQNVNHSCPNCEAYVGTYKI